MIDFDIILKYVCGLGSYQIILTVMVCYSSITGGFSSMGPVFLFYTPEFRCNFPPIDNSSIYDLNENEILNHTTPFDAEKEQYKTCYRYGFDMNACEDKLSECVNKSADPVKCDMGYHYDKSLFPKTIVTEFDLVCDRLYLNSLTTSMYMIGSLAGTFLFGNSSDRWGRKITMGVTYLLGFAASIGCAFTHVLWVICLCRFMIGCFGYGNYMSNFVYLLEITSVKWRTVVGVTYQICFALGYMILSGIAYQWRSWNEQLLVSSILFVPYLVFLFFIPESPRWLFSNEQVERGKQITRKFAKYNKVKLNEPEIWKEADVIEDKAEQEKGKLEKPERTYSTVDLFRTPKTRILTLNLLYNWFVNSLVYYGISLNTAALSGDIFVNNVLNGVMEIAAYLLVILLMDKTGRRPMLIFLLGLASLGLLVSTIVIEFARDSKSVETLSLIFAFAGKMGISGSYAVIYNFTTELYPTVIRSNGLSAGGTSAQLSSILAPFIIVLQKYVTWLPNVIFGVSAAIAAMLAFGLPETNSQSMMETIEEAELFYGGKKQKTVKPSKQLLPNSTPL